MLSVCLVLVVGIAVPSRGQAAEALQTRRLALASPVVASPIVGRAVCGASAWVLNRASELIEISPADRRTLVHGVRGLRPDARPWGLACVADGTLWTLETPRSLARIDRNGRVAERIDLTLPRIALFSLGDRLLFQQLPTVASAPLLASSLPREPFKVRSWAGLVGRKLGSQVGPLSGNFVNCGIGSGASIPCWFLDEGRLTVSDGAKARTHAPPGLKSASIDPTMPVWDAALVDSGWLWVLATSARGFDGRHAGGRLLRIDRDGREQNRIDLNPSARLIVAVTDTHCLLLTVLGELMEVWAS